MKKIICISLCFVLLCPLFCSCEKKEDISTDVKFSVYDNGDCDMISFYMTSDVAQFGTWNWRFDGVSFDKFHHNEETKRIGSFLNKTTVSYETLILKPYAEGESNIWFDMTIGEKEYTFIIKAEKDENGILRIKAKESSEDKIQKTA